MAQIFNVTTDYLLKDDIEAVERPEDTLLTNQDNLTGEKCRLIDLSQANDFIQSEKNRSPKMALGVLLCILSPILLIFLAGCEEYNLINISENVVAFIGLACLFTFVASGLYVILTGGQRKSEYKNIDIDDIETAYGVTGLAKELKSSFKDYYNKSITISIIMYVLCALPLILTGALDASEFVLICMVCVLLIIVALATYNIIRVNIIMSSYDILLQDGDFTKEKKEAGKKEYKSIWAILDVSNSHLSNLEFYYKFLG